MEASMNDSFIIIDTETGPIIKELDYATMTIEELQGYAMLGRDEAIQEILKREPRTGMRVDPYSPVTIPEP
jgi:hypothetical protein